MAAKLDPNHKLIDNDSEDSEDSEDSKDSEEIIAVSDSEEQSISYDEIDLVNNDISEKTNVNVENSPDNKNSCNNEENVYNGKNVTSVPKYKNLVLSGGSIRGISLVGAVKKLVDSDLIQLDKLKAVAGTSAGAMLSLLIVLGFSIDEIWNFIYFIDMKKTVNPNILLFLEKCGMETGEIIHNLFEEILAKKTGINNINFQQLHQITNIHLTMVGSCLTTKEIIYYDHINTPNFKVSMALRISIGIPGFFTPIVIGNKKYIDGGVLNNYPMNLFEHCLDETIGILISNEYYTDYTYPEEYFMAVLNLLLHNYFIVSYIKYKNNTIYVTKTPKNISPFNFNVDNHIKICLFNFGIQATEEYIKNYIRNE